MSTFSYLLETDSELAAQHPNRNPNPNQNPNSNRLATGTESDRETATISVSSSSDTDSATSSSSTSSSASLVYSVSSVPSYQSSAVPSSSVSSSLLPFENQQIYRGVDLHSSSLFSLPTQDLQSFSSLYPTQPLHTVKQKELTFPTSFPLSSAANHFTADSQSEAQAIPAHSASSHSSFSSLSSSVLSVSAASDTASDSDAAATVTSVIQSAPCPLPSYVEPYTSFYSVSSLPFLIATIPSILPPATLIRYSQEKFKFCCSFLCPRFSSLAVAFQIRIYSDGNAIPSESATPTFVVEASRRDGCSLVFSKLWKFIEKKSKETGIYSHPFTPSPFNTESTTAADVHSDHHSENDTSSPSLSACLYSAPAGAATLTPTATPTTSPVTVPIPVSAIPPSASAFDSNGGLMSLMSLVDQSSNNSILTNDAIRLLSMLAENCQSPTHRSQLIDSITRWAQSIVDYEGTSLLSRLMLILVKNPVSDEESRDMLGKWSSILLSILSLPIPATLPSPTVLFHYKRALACAIHILLLLSENWSGDVKALIGSDFLSQLEGKVSSQQCGSDIDGGVEERQEQVRHWLNQIRARLEAVA